MSSGVSDPGHHSTRSQVRLQVHPSDHNVSNQCSAPEGPVQGFGSSDGGPVPCGQTGSVCYSGSQFPWLLQSHLFGSQKERVLEADHRSVSSQSFFEDTTLQDGDDQVCSNGDTTRRLGCISGLSGCVFSHSSPPGLPKVPSIQIRRSDLSVPSSTVRPGSGATDIHYGSPSLRRSISFDGLQASSLSGRLAAPLPDQGPSSNAACVSEEERVLGRLDYKRRKVGIRSVSRLRFRWSKVPYRVGYHDPSLGQNRQNSRSRPQIQGEKRCVSSGVSSTSRVTEFCSRSDSTRTSVHASHSASPAVPVATICEPTGQADPSARGSSEASLGLLGFGVTTPSRSVFEHSAPRSVSVHRCLTPWVGRSSGRRRQVRAGHVDERGIPSSNKCIGNAGCPSSRKGIQSASKRQESIPLFGQFHSSGLYPKTRGHQVRHPMSFDLGIAASLQQGRHCLGTASYSGQTKYSGRCSVSHKQGCADGMDPPSGGGRQALPDMGFPHPRPVCDQAEQTSPSLLLSSARLQCSRSRQPVSPVGRAERVCVPSPAADSTRLEQSGQLQGQSDSDCTVLAQSGVVPSVAGAPSGPPTQNSPVVSSAVAPDCDDLSRKSRFLQASRLEIIGVFLRKRGFSEDVVQRMSQPQRGSTLASYQGKWSIFQSWCRDSDTSPVSPTIPKLLDFFSFLFNEKSLSVPAIKVYRSAIATTLKATGNWNLCWEDDIAALFRGMLVERPKTVQTTPKWDLSVVLRVLMKEPYEPMLHLSLKQLTLKTVFLVALATAQRRSELHAISFESLAFKPTGEAVLGFIPGFLAKNQRPSASRSPVIIPSLSGFCSSGIPDRNLCPVRALKFYHARTENPVIRRGRQRLFLSYKEGYFQEIAAPTITRWVVEVIRDSYSRTHSSRNLLRDAKISAHEVRALATSWASFKGVSIQEVVQAATWKSQSVFSDFYFRDCSTFAGGMHSVGPIVAAGHIV